MSRLRIPEDLRDDLLMQIADELRDGVSEERRDLLHGIRGLLADDLGERRTPEQTFIEEHGLLCSEPMNRPIATTEGDNTMSDRPTQHTEAELDDLHDRLHGRRPPKREPELVESADQKLDRLEAKFSAAQLAELDVALALSEAGGSLAMTDDERAVAQHRAERQRYKDDLRRLDGDLKAQRARLDEMARAGRVSNAPSEGDLDRLHADVMGDVLREQGHADLAEQPADADRLDLSESEHFLGRAQLVQRGDALELHAPPIDD